MSELRDSVESTLAAYKYHEGVLRQLQEQYLHEAFLRGLRVDSLRLLTEQQIHDLCIKHAERANRYG